MCHSIIKQIFYVCVCVYIYVVCVFVCVHMCVFHLTLHSVNSLDIHDILTLVNEEVNQLHDSTVRGPGKQSPALIHSLRKKLIFSRPQWILTSTTVGPSGGLRVRVCSKQQLLLQHMGITGCSPMNKKICPFLSLSAWSSCEENYLFCSLKWFHQCQ